MRRYCIIICMLLLTSLFVSQTSKAQEGNHYLIFGKIYDSEGKPFKNITVVITNLETDESITNNTDNDGRYQKNLVNLKEGWEDGNKILINTKYRSSYIAKTFIVKSKDGGKQVDITLPSIKIDNSSENFLVNESVNVEIVVNKTLEIKNVHFFIDNDLIYNSTSTKWNWNTLEFKNGNYELKAVAYGPDNDTYEASIVVEVVNDNPSENGENDKNWLFVILIIFICLFLVILLIFKSFKMKKKVEKSQHKSKKKSKK